MRCGLGALKSSAASDLKFLNEVAASGAGTSNRRHRWLLLNRGGAAPCARGQAVLTTRGGFDHLDLLDNRPVFPAIGDGADHTAARAAFRLFDQFPQRLF